MIILGKGKGSKKNILDGKDHLELLRNNKYGSGCSSKNKYPPMFTLICEPILIQSAIKSWCSVFIPFRLYRRKDGSYSKPRLSLRKYQYMQNGKVHWTRQQNYNLNTVTEAKQLYKLLITYFPEVLRD